MNNDETRHEQFQAPVDEIQVNFLRHTAVVRLAPGTCCDMFGCIAAVQEIDPEVREIRTFAGNKPDTSYLCIGTEWRAVRALKLAVSC